MAKKRPIYSDYRRPRKKGGNPFLEVIIVLLLLILIAFFVFSRVMGGSVKIEDGKLHIILPDSQTENPPPLETPPLVIEEPSPEPSEEPSPSVEPEPSPEPDPAPPVICAVEISAEQLVNGSAAESAAEAGANTLVVTMKPASGVTAWSAENSSAADAVRILAEESDLYLVARVACFRDQALVASRMGGPLTTKGGNPWYDYYGMRWVSPASEEVRGYLIRLCIELTGMGFDEILLEFAGYPYFGETHVLGTNDLRPEDLTAPVNLFWREMRTALNETEVRVSALVTAEMISGTDEYSGITPQLLAQYADRVWVKAGESDCVTPLEDAGMENAARRLVYIGGTAEDTGRADLKNVIG